MYEADTNQCENWWTTWLLIWHRDDSLYMYTL